MFSLLTSNVGGSTDATPACQALSGRGTRTCWADAKKEGATPAVAADDHGTRDRGAQPARTAAAAARAGHASGWRRLLGGDGIGAEVRARGISCPLLFFFPPHEA